ncbi:ABC transporter permease [Bacillus cereus]|nr:ABC transporter permease [Bacillus cereus]
MFHQNHEPLKLLSEQTEHTENKYECREEMNIKVPFCCIFQVPHGFQYVPHSAPKIAYNLDCLSVVEESCRKTIQVEDCGPVEVKLSLLKVVGCISYIANATVEGECGKDCDYDANGHHWTNVCCSGSICVDNVLKCSIECLPHYTINCHNVVVSDFTVKPVHNYGCEMLQFTGTIEFKHIPYE